MPSSARPHEACKRSNVGQQTPQSRPLAEPAPLERGAKSFPLRGKCRAKRGDRGSYRTEHPFRKRKTGWAVGADALGGPRRTQQTPQSRPLAEPAPLERGVKSFPLRGKCRAKRGDRGSYRTEHPFRKRKTGWPVGADALIDPPCPHRKEIVQICKPPQSRPSAEPAPLERGAKSVKRNMVYNSEGTWYTDLEP